jgi:hypothetical protein
LQVFFFSFFFFYFILRMRAGGRGSMDTPALVVVVAEYRTGCGSIRIAILNKRKATD